MRHVRNSKPTCPLRDLVGRAALGILLPSLLAATNSLAGDASRGVAPAPARSVSPVSTPLARTPGAATVSIQAPEDSDDARALERLRRSRNPVIVEMLRLMDERDRQLEVLRSKLDSTRDPGARLALEDEASHVKQTCERGVLVAQLAAAREIADGGARAREIERDLANLDRRMAASKASAMSHAPISPGR